MTTVLKVRDRLKSYDDPGPYQAPSATLASIAASADLKRDGIDVAHPPKAQDG